MKTKQFQILSDAGLAWELMTDVFSPDACNGPFAPFFEYALNSSWLNKDYLHLNRFWLDGDRPVAFVFYENPASQLRFALRPGYEHLAEEMIAYAESAFPDLEEPRELALYAGQSALIRAAEKRGWHLTVEEPWRIFDFGGGRLDFALPKGYRFVPSDSVDPLKAAICLWEGFNSEELGPFQGWDVPTQNGGRSPYELYREVLKSTVSPPPHATYEDQVIIADRNGRYVCFSGMWWVEKNRLAYMEPLCTVPDCRRLGLAAAALAEHDRRLRPRGAVMMTGGGNMFYEKIGFQRVIRCLYYRK
jgi:GNAT superfamily N-acetyltransferase